MDLRYLGSPSQVDLNFDGPYIPFTLSDNHETFSFWRNALKSNYFGLVMLWFHQKDSLYWNWKWYLFHLQKWYILHFFNRTEPGWFLVSRLKNHHWITFWILKYKLRVVWACWLLCLKDMILTKSSRKNFEFQRLEKIFRDQQRHRSHLLKLSFWIDFAFFWDCHPEWLVPSYSIIIWYLNI